MSDFNNQNSFVPPPPPKQQAPQQTPNQAYQQSAYQQPYQTQQQYAATQNYSSSTANRDTSPMSVGQYIITFIILAIPLVNIIMLFVWSFGSSANVNKRNFSRATLIIMLIAAILYAIIGAAIFNFVMNMLSSMGGGFYY